MTTVEMKKFQIESCKRRFRYELKITLICVIVLAVISLSTFFIDKNVFSFSVPISFGFLSPQAFWCFKSWKHLRQKRIELILVEVHES